MNHRAKGAKCYSFDNRPTKLLREIKGVLAVEEERSVVTTCTIDCGGKCPINVNVNNSVITRIDTYSDGKVPPLKACIRGLNYHYRVYAPDRLKYPLIRVGERGGGRFRRISWEQALDIVANEMLRIKKTYGTEAILECTYSGAMLCLLHKTLTGATYRLLNRFGGRTAFGTSTSEVGAYWASRFTYGITNGADGSSMSDLVNSKLIILWGLNPVETRWGTDTLYWMLRAKKKGIKFVCIDPCYTDTSRVLAAEHVPIKPSTDTAMLIAMAYVLITEGLYDKEYVNKYVFGFDKYQDYVLGKIDGVSKTPQWAAEITGVPAPTIARLAREYALSKPAALIQGYSPGRTANGEQYHRAAIALQAMTGNIGMSGGSSSCDGLRYRAGLPRHSVRATDSSSLLMWGGKGVEIKPAKWADAVLRGKAGGYPSDIKMILAVGHNILTSRANVKKGVEAFKKVEFVVCQ